jgi:hypothetical protein
MGKKRNKIVGSGVSFVVGAIWTSYDRFTTIRGLPSDASDFVKMLTDPPWYLPWAVMLVSALVLAWAFWEKEGPDDAGVSQTSTTSGPNSPAIAAHNSTVHNYFASPPPADVQPMKQAVGYRDKPAGWNADSASALHRVMTGYNPTPDMPLAGVLVRVYRAMGGPPDDTSHLSQFYRKVDLEIVDKVSQNDMSVWGRIGDRPLERIRMESWRMGGFDHRAKCFRAVNIDAVHRTKYAHLHFNKAEVDEIWPDDKPQPPKGSPPNPSGPYGWMT